MRNAIFALAFTALNLVPASAAAPFPTILPDRMAKWGETVEVKVFTENNGASSAGFRLPGAHTELTWKADEGAYVGRFA
ncbi:hypothetical protein K2X33_10215, partial [bacterium]|nr:hypothetical protein [bacterium]